MGYILTVLDCIHCGGIQTMEEYFDYNNNEYIYDCSQCGYHNHLTENDRGELAQIDENS